MSDSSVRLPPLFAELPEPFVSFYDPQAPWRLLDEALDAALAGLPDRAIEGGLAAGVHLVGAPIVVTAGATIGPGSVIEGPIWIGPGVEIRPGAYLRGGVWLGAGAIVGASTEVKRAIFLPGARAPHLNYVGDSILGAEVNLGAGTILSNFRHDGGEIRAGSLATGRRKLGAILGDGVMTGCNSVCHPGSIVGRGTHLYPGVQLRAGIYPADSIVKLRQETEVVERKG